MQVLCFILIVHVLVVGVTQGLMCWQCENALDDADCQRIGELVQCLSNEETCFTETRLVLDDVKLMTRRCKQDLACKNNADQNTRPAWTPTQCNAIQGSVCRCCCSTDGCNSAEDTACKISYDPDKLKVCEVVDYLENGNATCEVAVASIRSKVTCYYECDEGYELIGEPESVCESSLMRPPNDHEIPLCLDISGSGENRLGTTTLLIEKDWAFPAVDGNPLCSALTPPVNGAMECSHQTENYWVGVENGIGSICHFICNKGLELYGSEKSSCIGTVDGSAEYDSPTPICRGPPICSRLFNPMNGVMTCDHEVMTDGVGSFCRFSCLPGFEIVGESVSSCVRDNDDGSTAAYNKPAPTCREIRCEQPTLLRRVYRSCSDGNDIGSTCEFQCEREIYTPNPGSIMQSQCLMDGTWSSPPPCCRLPCPPNTIMDLIIVLDSSSSVKLKNWEKMTTFVSLVISKMKLNVERSQVFLIRYNADVDRHNQLLFKDNENLDQIMAALSAIPYDGVGTKTGRALRFVYQELLHRPENRKNVTDVVLLLTDGRATDDVAVISQKLRDDGVEMFAVGVGNAKQSQLLEIAGSEKRLWSDMTNFDELTTEAATTIGQHICEKSCT